MKVVYFAPSPRSAGQVLIGLSLAEQLRKSGTETHFIVAEAARQVMYRRKGFPYTLINESAGPLTRLVVDEVMEEFRPDIIVIGDYLGYSYAIEKSYRLDPWFIEQYNMPILPVDIWELDRTGLAVDFCGEQIIPVGPRILGMNARLVPVPIAHPKLDNTEHAFRYRLIDDLERVTRRTRGHLHTTFGLGAQDRLILLSLANWQMPNAELYSQDRNRIAQAVPRLLAHYLSQLPETAHFLLVGSVPEGLKGSLPPERTIVLPPCPPARFDVLLGSADLVLSLNASAVTLARAVLSGTPAMLLSNRFTVTGDNEIETTAAALGGLAPYVSDWLASALPLYPFRMWPLGYHAFLEPVLTGNPYAAAFATAEILDQEGVVSGLEQLLFDAGTRTSLAGACHAYQQQLAVLPDTGETFARAARIAGA